MHKPAQSVPPGKIGLTPDAEHPKECGVPGCSASLGPSTCGVCAEHRAQELAAQCDADQLLALDVELAVIRGEEAQAERQHAERLAELRRERERSTWARDRDVHERRVAGVMRAVLHQFEADIANGRERNGALLGAAWAVGRLVAGGEVAEESGRAELLDMAAAVGLPKGEARGVIRRRFAAARKSPRILEDRRAA